MIVLLPRRLVFLPDLPADRLLTCRFLKFFGLLTKSADFFADEGVGRIPFPLSADFSADFLSDEGHFSERSILVLGVLL